MKIEKLNDLVWSDGALASALKLAPTDIREYFTDGRRAGFLCERRLAMTLNGRLARSERDGYDLNLPGGQKWEVRCITNHGVSFSPSGDQGKGRAFDRASLFRKLRGVAGYILCDVERFPVVPCWKVPSSVIETWWNDNKLGGVAKPSRVSILALLNTPAK